MKLLKCSCTFLLIGRSYLAKNSELIASLITCLKTETNDMLTQDHALGCLQRLSLKSVTVMMICIRLNSTLLHFSWFSFKFSNNF